MFRPLTVFSRNRNAPATPDMSGDPFYRLQNEMNRLFEDAFSGFPLGFSSGVGVGANTPRVDLRETADALEACVELPGVSEKDIDVEIADNTLMIRGEKRSERKEDDERAGYHFMERTYGSFQRAIPLPVEIDEDRVEGVFRDGVLTLTLPKAPDAQRRTRRIEIRRGDDQRPSDGGARRNGREQSENRQQA